jgi:anaerobic selenocysteine-containing dehydrogenase
MARSYASLQPACIVQGINSLNQQASGFQNHRAICILQSITGNVDVAGGFISVDLGGTEAPSVPNYSPLRLPELVTEKTVGQKEYPLFVQGWTGQGMLLPDMILTGKPYPIKGLTVVASNPAITWPNSKKVKKALESLEFLVVMTMRMNETAELADLVLPAASFLERTETWEIPSFSYSKPFINLRNKVIDFHECWPDLKFWLELGKEMGFQRYFPWNDVEEVIEYAFEPSGIDIREYLGKANIIPFGEVKYKWYEAEGFRTPSGKVELYSAVMKELGLDPLPTFQEPPESPIASPEIAKDYPIILTTGSRNIQYTHSSFREISKFRKRHPEPYAEIHPTTAECYQVRDEDMMIVETKRGAIEIKAKLTEDILPNVINIPHGWSQSNVNVLTDEKPIDPVTGYPTLKCLLCKISVKRGNDAEIR